MEVTEETFEATSGRYVTALTAGAETGRLLLLAHGAGGSARSPAIAALAAALVERGFRVTRFNFPYREEGRRAPDRPAVLLATWQAAARRYGGPEAILAGTSMGGRYASMVLAGEGGEVPDAAGLVLFAYPLHPPGRPGQMRAAHLPRVRVPILFISGDRDPFSSGKLLPETVALLSQAQLVIVAGADHAFNVKGRSDEEVKREMADASFVFARRLEHRATVHLLVDGVDTAGALAWFGWSVAVAAEMINQLQDGRRSFGFLPSSRVRLHTWRMLTAVEQAARVAQAQGHPTFALHHAADQRGLAEALLTQRHFMRFLEDLARAGELPAMSPAARVTANGILSEMGKQLGLGADQVPFFSGG